METQKTSTDVSMNQHNVSPSEKITRREALETAKAVAIAIAGLGGILTITLGGRNILNNLLHHKTNGMPEDDAWLRAVEDRDVDRMIAICNEAREHPEQYHIFTHRLLDVLGQIQEGSVVRKPTWGDYFPQFGFASGSGNTGPRTTTNFSIAKDAAHYRYNISLEALQRSEEENEGMHTLDYCLSAVQSMRMTNATLEEYEAIFDLWRSREISMGADPRSLFEYCRNFDILIAHSKQREGSTFRDQTQEEKDRAQTRFNEYQKALNDQGIDWHKPYNKRRA